MKVLKLIHTQGHGGAENTFRWLAWGLQREGVEVVSAIPASNPGKENWISPALEESGVPYLTFDKSGTSLRLLKNITAVIKEVRPDIVHSHLLDSNLYSSIACSRLGVPHVCTEHGDVSFRQNAISRLKYGIISLSSQYIICVSNAVRENASRFILFPGKLKTVYNGVRFFENKPSTFRDEFDIPRNAFLIGNVGNLYPVKGQRFLIRAFAAFLESCPGAYLALVGRGAEETNLRELVLELKIPRERVLFTGFRNDVENIMNALDLYIQPSLSEGHPVALLEAMSLGIPVIATSVGGVPEVIGNDRYGSLAAPGSWEDILRVMRYYLDHPDILRERAETAKTYVRDTYSLKSMALNYLELYHKVLDGHRSRH